MTPEIPYSNQGKADTIPNEGGLDVITCSSCEKQLSVAKGVCWVICPNCKLPNISCE